MHFMQDLHLSDPAVYHDWASGGFLGDTKIDGKLDMGTQQQFLVRNTAISGGTVMAVRNGNWGQILPWNYVYVGSTGTPSDGATVSNGKPVVSTVAQTPIIAEKPHLVYDAEEWFIAVPSATTNSVGPSFAGGGNNSHRVPIRQDTVFVAKPGMTGSDIAQGIIGKQALLITPALYEVTTPIIIAQSDFVVLGLGYATLLSMHGKQCLTVQSGTFNVRVAGVMCDAMPGSHTSDRTEPLLQVFGSDHYLSDVFTRVGTWADESRVPKRSRADVMLHLVGNQITADNLWLWYADHSTNRAAGCYLPECTSCDPAGGPTSVDEVSLSDTALLVEGSDVTVYCLMAEHTAKDVVHWVGERGATYMFQCELPYTGEAGLTGVKLWVPESRAYFVEDSATGHKGVGWGAYPVNPCWGEEWWWQPVPKTNTLFQVPADADLKLVLGWNNGCGSNLVNTYVNVLVKGTQKYGENHDGCDSKHTYGLMHGYCYLKRP
jgi:hypothetical protein